MYDDRRRRAALDRHRHHPERPIRDQQLDRYALGHPYVLAGPHRVRRVANSARVLVRGPRSNTTWYRTPRRTPSFSAVFSCRVTAAVPAVTNARTSTIALICS
jgi:hypothetical protein